MKIQIAKDRIDVSFLFSNGIAVKLSIRAIPLFISYEFKGTVEGRPFEWNGVTNFRSKDDKSLERFIRELALVSYVGTPVVSLKRFLDTVIPERDENNLGL